MHCSLTVFKIILQYIIHHAVVTVEESVLWGSRLGISCLRVLSK